MTASSYTQGPFCLTEDDGELLLVAPDPDLPGCYGLLAQVIDCDFPDQALANGHLLAAAPDLLTALREIMIYTGEYPSKRPYCGGSFLPERLFEAAAAAIARAEGE